MPRMLPPRPDADTLFLHASCLSLSERLREVARGVVHRQDVHLLVAHNTVDDSMGFAKDLSHRRNI